MSPTRHWGAVLLFAAALSLTSCGINDTEYRVADKFQYANPKDLDHRFFLELAPAGKEAKHKDVFVNEKQWMECYLEDLFVVRYIGRDSCKRTPQSRLDIRSTPIPIESLEPFPTSK